MEHEDPDLERFYKFTHRSPDSDCLIWHGSINRTGYGRFKYKRKQYEAHRFIYIKTHNNGVNLPSNVVIRHTCDTKNCVDLAHLIEGSYSDNLRDAYERGQRSKNSDSPFCKNGHERNAENKSIRKGYVGCKVCERESARKYREKLLRIKHENTQEN